MCVTCITCSYYLASSAGKMNQILHCDWLPEQARWSHLARSGLPAWSRKKSFPKSHIINPLLTKPVRSRWLDIGLILFFACLWTSTLSRSINTQKKELGQYPAILTTHLVNNPYIQTATKTIPGVSISTDVRRKASATSIRTSATFCLN